MARIRRYATEHLPQLFHLIVDCNQTALAVMLQNVGLLCSVLLNVLALAPAPWGLSFQAMQKASASDPGGNHLAVPADMRLNAGRFLSVFQPLSEGPACIGV